MEIKKHEIDIHGLDKAELLAALYNNSKVIGIGALLAAAGRSPPMSKERAAELITGDPEQYFDYLSGRVMKVGIGRDVLSTRLYNRDVGEGAAERVVATLRAEIAARKGKR